jgi:oxazoline/thiazoline dehydrogenase
MSAPGSDFVLALRPEVEVEVSSDRRAALRCAWARVRLGVIGPGLQTALDRLRGTGGTRVDLAALVVTDGPGATATLYYCLEAASRQRLLSYGVRAGAGLLARATPTTGGPLRLRELPEDTCYQLSRFALLRRVGHQMLLESPVSPVEVELPTSTGTALVAALAEPRTVDELAAACPPAGRTEASQLLRLLAAAGLVIPAAPETQVDEGGGKGEPDIDPATRLWEFHDLLFFSRSRRGRHGHPYGATSPGRDLQLPLPAFRRTGSGPVVCLPTPDLHHITRHDPPFGTVVEARQSVRQHGSVPINVQQLAELLFRVARARQVARGDPDDPTSYEVTNRPYPSGGATYDLEVYLTIHACAGLGPGLYHYDPRAHELRLVRGASPETAALLVDAARSALLDRPPQVLVTLASRFGRVSWRYSSIAHAITLKNVGVLLQTFCLAATAMGLAACPVGGGDSDAFAAAAGTNYYEETSVGELILGSRAAPDESAVSAIRSTVTVPNVTRTEGGAHDARQTR